MTSGEAVRYGQRVSERDRDRRDGSKRSWRELDAMRDKARGGGARPEERGRPGELKGERASKQYRAALDALFEQGGLQKAADTLLKKPEPPSLQPAPGRKVGAESAAPSPAAAPSDEAKETPKDETRAALRKKLLEALGRDEISRAVDRYVKAYGPAALADFEVLEQALEHQKADKQADALAALEKLLQRERPKRNRTLLGKLRFIEETGGDADLVSQAARVRQLLGG